MFVIDAIAAGVVGFVFIFGLWILAIWLGGKCAELYGRNKALGWIVGLFTHLVGVAIMYVIFEVFYPQDKIIQPEDESGS